MNKRINLCGIFYTITDYEDATQVIIDHAAKRHSYGVSALAVHGLVTAYKNASIKALVNKIDLVVPDGQPIRWAMNSFYKAGLKERVYGPTLTLKVLEQSNLKRLKIYLYGSTKNTVEKFSDFIALNFPDVIIAGIHVDRFRDATEEEDRNDIEKINASDANIVLVGRGCPRQEIWVANHLGEINAVMMAVGAAFDFHAGIVKQSPSWMQRYGLEWLFRFIQEPRRLWKRYLFTNSLFIYLFFKHKFFLKKPY